jgi:diguanylate cyclase (GGDEF)-like protein
LLLYLLALLTLAFWAGVQTQRQAEFTRGQVTLSDGWKDARYWLAQEETLERKEMLEPASYIRDLHTQAAAEFEHIVRQMGDMGSPADERRADHVIRANTRYLRAMHLMFAARERGKLGQAQAIHEAIDPTYDRVEHDVSEEVNHYHLSEYLALAELDRTQEFVVWATPISALFGLVVLGAFFVVLQGYQRRLDAARREEIVRLERAALCDALTQLGNHRAFQEAMRRARAPRGEIEAPVTLALIDIDDFKRINDSGGHRTGDAVLEGIASVLRAHVGDRAFRTGGDEFAVVADDMTLQEAARRMERIRDEIARAPFGATISVGVAADDAALELPERLFERADAALYDAKHHGRNRVVCFTESEAVAAARSANRG